MNDAKKKDLTQQELRGELEARKLRLDQHLSGLQSELTVADVNVGGRPVLDYVREKPLAVAGVAVGVGLLTGVVTGLMKREAPEPLSERDLWMSAYLNDLLDESAHRVQRGEDSDAALRRSLRRRAPVVVLEADEPPLVKRQSSLGGLLLKTAFGFGVKFALDQLAQQMTSESELFEAMESEVTDEGGTSPPPTVTPIEPTYQ